MVNEVSVKKVACIISCIGLSLTYQHQLHADYNAYVPEGLGLKKIFKLETYKKPRTLAIATSIIALFRLLGKDPNIKRLTIAKAIKGLHPKKILSYPLHVLQCIDDIILGYPGPRKKVHLIINNRDGFNPYQSYGILGTTWSHCEGVAERLKVLKHLREILLYLKHALAQDLA